MAKELQALELNGTWTLSTLPPRKKPVDCFTEVEGVDFGETFAPVAKLATVRCFLAVAVMKKWEIHQMDVHNAFLHGDLHEEVYMSLPPGLSSNRPGQVCRLRKSLYGLRQASRNWFSKLVDALYAYGFKQSRADNSLFTYSRGTIFIAVLIYVDDLLVAGNSSLHCTTFKRHLVKIIGTQLFLCSFI
ncbi:hypothetical protein CRG98_010205 [Punica granatum]|uniref:Reverse transcriptase Ty1/copia-type domain-containing protein n=1 Tax=Punica granatum TaxID=22663 RepID=A0A2I0KLM7_PUNGR|nr:hypothetical protein CRG98_010205 [Punica granatum]